MRDREYHYHSVEDGWKELVKPLVDYVLDNGGAVVQVKEKFGGLRFYYDPPSERTEEEDKLWQEFDQRVREAESKSYSICEFTGKSGRPRTTSRWGWIKTVSDEVAEREGYDRDVDII